MRTGEKRSEVVSPLAVTAETITRRDMICKGKKTARNDERTIHGTESQTTGSLARFFVNQSGESQEHTKEEGKVGLLLPAFDVGGGGMGEFGDKEKYCMSQTGREGKEQQQMRCLLGTDPHSEIDNDHWYPKGRNFTESLRSMWQRVHGKAKVR